MRKFVLMGIDECGDEFRLHGDAFLESEFVYPDFNPNDSNQLDIFNAWCDIIADKAMSIWRSIYGSEVRHIWLDEVIRPNYFQFELYN